MILNENIYGTAAQQTSVAPSNVYSEHCKFSTIVPTLYAYATAYGKDNPIDNSVALWQIHDSSWKNGQTWFRRDLNGVIQTTTTKNVNPQSLWLCVPVTFALSHNLHMQNSSNSCQLWNGETTSQYYMSANSNKRAIITEFDYNRLQARIVLYCKKFDNDTKIHSGSSRTFNIYDYFKAGDANGDYKDQYCIEAVRITVCCNSGDTGNATTEHRTSNIIPITAESGFSGSYSGRLYTNTPFESPHPNDVYYDNTYMVYAQDYDIFGIEKTNSNSYIPQMGSFAGTNSYRVEGINNADWVVDKWLEGSTPYIATRCTADYDTFMKQIAMLGFWFDECEVIDTIYQVRLGEYCNDDHVCMPEIIGGRTTGNFKRGATAAADPQAAWGNDWRDNVNYQGDRPYTLPDGDSGDLTSIFHHPSIIGSCNYYNFTSTNLRDLMDYINSTYQPTDAQFINDFKGVNPADYIASCMYYPDNYMCPNASLTPVGVSIGALSGSDTGITALQADTSSYVTYGSITIPTYFGDFRDYAPYTTLDLYVPFCGNTELDTAQFIGHTLSVYLLVDYPTGNCTGIIMRDSMVYDTLNGSCGVSVPLTAANMGQWQNSIKSAEIALKQAELQRKSAWLATAAAGASTIAGIATMNPLAIAGGVGGLVGASFGMEKANLAVESAQYQLTHTAASTRSISAASPANSIRLDYDCHLLIKRPVMSTGYDAEIYAHTVGNACAINAPLKYFSGLVVCADADLSGISAPAEIKTAILNALKSGVYI